MRRRRRASARELETAAAARPAPRARSQAARARAPPLPAAGGEALAMLVRRGLAPRPVKPDLPWPEDLDEETAARLSERLGHYAFRLFLRGAILLGPGPFAPARATRFLSSAQGRAMAEDLVALGLAAPAPRSRFVLVHRAHTFGPALEWWIARELRERLLLDVAYGIRSGAPGVGGDLDVVAAGEGKLVYVELKSSPPKHLTGVEVAAFLRRVDALRPDVAVFAMDTALRLGDKVLPMFAGALGEGAARPRRVIRDTWALTPHLYVANARQDLVENLCRAIAEGFKARGPGGPG